MDTPVLLACRDLMTASRLELAEGVDVRRFGDLDSLLQAVLERPDAVVVVDLTAFAEAPGAIRGGVGGDRVAIVAFAPHVHDELLDVAREHADLVVPRGAVMKSLALQVRRAATLHAERA